MIIDTQQVFDKVGDHWESTSRINVRVKGNWYRTFALLSLLHRKDFIEMQEFGENDTRPRRYWRRKIQNAK